jgi:hypothetical protein
VTVVTYNHAEQVYTLVLGWTCHPEFSLPSRAQLGPALAGPFFWRPCEAGAPQVRRRHALGAVAAGKANPSTDKRNPIEATLGLAAGATGVREPPVAAAGTAGFG